MGRNTSTIDWFIIVSAVILNCLSLVTLLSLEPQLFYQQLFFTVVGIILFWVLYRFDFAIFEYLTRHMFVIVNVFLLLSFLGPDVRGATRWLEFGSVRFQPSEIVKPFLLLAWAGFVTNMPPTKIKAIFYHALLFIIPTLLVYKQPDLGNAIVYTFMWGTMIILGGISMGVVVLTGIVGAILTPTIFHFLRDYQKLRLITFLNPGFDPQGAGYNAIQSLIAVGAGGWFGRGFGRGTQSLLQFLPERLTDFIFATYAEEFGLVGGTVMLVLFFVLLWRIFQKGRQLRSESFALLYVGGLGMQFLVQTVVNIGMNLGVVPITGITLPFVSYGGSSLLASWVSIGILMSILRQRVRE